MILYVPDAGYLILVVREGIRYGHFSSVDELILSGTPAG